jgi:NAD(P)-dependent dehydrogenase (short-subunit alcohol dehydrogenase family)
VKRPKVVLVTGSSSGIGLAVAREAARRGHRVFASARRPEALAGEPNLQRLRLDVTEFGAAARAVARLRRSPIRYVSSSRLLESVSSSSSRARWTRGSTTAHSRR